MANTVAPTQQVDNFIPDSFFETLDKAKKYLGELNSTVGQLQEIGIKVTCSVEANDFFSKLSF